MNIALCYFRFNYQLIIICCVSIVYPMHCFILNLSTYLIVNIFVYWRHSLQSATSKIPFHFVYRYIPLAKQLQKKEVPLLCYALCTGVVLNQQNMSTAGIFRFSFLAIRLLTIQAINRFIRVCWNIQMLHCFPVLAIPDRDIMSHNKMDDVVMTQYDSDKNSTCIWIEFLAYLICRHYHLPARRCGHEALPPHAF